MAVSRGPVNASTLALVGIIILVLVAPMQPSATAIKVPPPVTVGLECYNKTANITDTIANTEVIFTGKVTGNYPGVDAWVAISLSSNWTAYAVPHEIHIRGMEVEWFNITVVVPADSPDGVFETVKMDTSIAVTLPRGGIYYSESCTLLVEVHREDSPVVEDETRSSRSDYDVTVTTWGTVAGANYTLIWTIVAALVIGGSIGAGDWMFYKMKKKRKKKVKKTR